MKTHSFNLTEFFRQIMTIKEGMKFKHFDLAGDYDAAPMMRKNIQNLSNIFRMSDNITLTNIAFGKKIDKINPYNEIIELPDNIKLERIDFHTSPFYLRKSPESAPIVVSEVRFMD